MTTAARIRLCQTMPIAILVLTLALIAPPNLVAQDAASELSQTETMDAQLQRHVGKRVKLKMKSGNDLDGKVVKVGMNLVHIAELSGMEFYDAIVRIDHIGAVVIKARAK